MTGRGEASNGLLVINFAARFCSFCNHCNNLVALLALVDLVALAALVAFCLIDPSCLSGFSCVSCHLFAVANVSLLRFSQLPFRSSVRA